MTIHNRIHFRILHISSNFKISVVGEVEVSFLHPNGPTPSFHYPNNPDILTMSSQDILTSVNITTAAGRTYILSEEETSKATSTLTMRQQRL